MRLALVCFYCLCVFVYVFYFIATMSFAGYFLSVLLCLLSMLISDSRFDLVWFRLSCDHGWIRSGSVNVRKQQQQQQQHWSKYPLVEVQRERINVPVLVCCAAIGAAVAGATARLLLSIMRLNRAKSLTVTFTDCSLSSLWICLFF